jgi:hypothetical protein
VQQHSVQKLGLLDHLVGDAEQRRRHGEAEHPGRLGVDDQLETYRLYDRQLSGARAFKNLTDVDATLAICV